ncbi:MAG: hydrogenase maturation protease, partial [Candidatus Eisenbacteria bacterium]
MRDPLPAADRGARIGAPIHVIGIGRLDRGDDAAGRLVVRALKGRFAGGLALIEAEGGMTELLDAWRDADAVIVVDAVRSGARAGTLLRYDAGREPLPLAASDSTHGLGLAEAVELTRTLGRLPGALIVHGIEGESFAVGAAMSAAVRAGLLELTERVAAEAQALIETTERSTPRQRLRVEIRGAVQGVGFRPFVYRLATELSLEGWVLNDARGVSIEVEGPRAPIKQFLARLSAEAPTPARIHSIESEWLEAAGFERFEIRHSDGRGAKGAVPFPEIATCESCLAEVLDPRDRRHRYPFANCTRCGPRFTILRELPYDRPNTTMSGFELCGACRAEYEDPADRRFHAQPIACAACGPVLSLLDRSGRP